MVPFLLALLQSPVGAPAGQPLRVTLDPSTVAPGEAVHVFVEVATAGHLLVLRVAADGRVEVVFPGQPTEGTFVSAGSYEIQPPGRSAAFFANERPGGGVVLAALALVPYEFDEFVRGGAWDGAALAGGAGSDATGQLLDVVQRMLGPEYFHYDVAAYTVAPYTTAESDVVGGAYGGFVSSWGWGYWPGGWWGWTPAYPCAYGRWGCGFDPGFCDGFGQRGRCDWTCRDGFGCGEWSRQTAVARYRRGEPLFATGQPPLDPAPAPSTPVRPRRREPAPAAAAAATTASTLRGAKSGGSAPATAAAARAPTVRRPRETAATSAAMPARVPWPGTVIASGRKTPTPAVRPRDAAVKQSASRPPMPERVPWPTGSAPRAWQPGASAVAASMPAKLRTARAIPAEAAVGRRGGAVASPTTAAVAAPRAVPRSLAPATAAGASTKGAAATVGGGGSGSRAGASGRAAPSAGGRAYVPARSAPAIAAPRVGGVAKP